MKAARLVVAHHSLELPELPRFTLGNTDVLVRVHAAGIAESRPTTNPGAATPYVAKAIEWFDERRASHDINAAILPDCLGMNNSKSCSF